MDNDWPLKEMQSEVYVPKEDTYVEVKRALARYPSFFFDSLAILGTQ
jgi:hypothetical protein